MAEHMVTLWLETDDDFDLETLDFNDLIGNDDNYNERVKITHQTKRTFPWSDVYHEISWWITKKLTLDEWSELDNLESEVLYKICGDEFMGSAGPIPFND